MGIDESPWFILGTPFRCLGVPPAIKPDLDALLGSFPRRPAAPEEIVEFRVEEGTGSTFLAGGGSRWDLTGSADPLSSHIEYRIVDEAIRRAPGRWVLHAGAVAVPGGGPGACPGTCLIIGESGAGKTSLTLWLWANGLRLGTDDLCPILQGGLEPESFPRSLHMDEDPAPPGLLPPGLLPLPHP